MPGPEEAARQTISQWHEILVHVDAFQSMIASVAGLVIVLLSAYIAFQFKMAAQISTVPAPAYGLGIFR
jgi:hypothetical protein